MTGARGPVGSPPEPAGADAVSTAVLRGKRAVQRCSLGGRLGHFCGLEPIGQGGMGAVFAAHDERLGRRVALKVIRGEVDARRRARMLREAQALAKLSHPNVVAIYEVGEHNDELYIAMELIDGQTLRRWVRGRSRAEVLSIYLQAGRGLAAAHVRGLVHRDFKPDNVVVGEVDGEATPRARVLDFGVARLGDEVPTFRSGEHGPCGSDPLRLPGLGTPLTQTGSLVGTPAYMAPEQFSGDRTDARTDQFSFCVALYEALYGERPFAGRQEQTLLRNINAGRVQPAPRGSAVPWWQRAVLLRGLAVRPEERYPSMDALLVALGNDPRRRRRAWSVAGVGLVAAAGLAAWPQLEREVGVRACEREGGAIHHRWNEERAGELAAAFEATGNPHAPEAWARTQAALDEYAARWASERSELCVAVEVDQTRLPEELVRARECFDDARFGLEALVGRLEAPEVTVVRDAPMLAARLSHLESCSDPELLRGQARPPQDEATRDASRSLRERLSQVRVDLRFPVGTEVSRRALAEAKATLAEAEALGWAPLVARAQLTVGQGLQTLGRAEEAEAMYEAAFFTAGHAGQGQVALSASNALMTVVGPMLHRPEDALRWSRQAELEIDRLGLEDELPVAAYLHDLGNVHNARGQHAEALRAYREALALLERRVGPEDLAVAQYLRPVAYCYSALGDHEAALEVQRRVMAIIEGELQSDHPMMAGALSVLAGIDAARGELDAALEAQRRAVDIGSRALGVEHPRVIAMRGNLGTVLWMKGAYAEALVAYEEVLAVQQRQHGPDHPALAETLNKVGVAQLGLGRVEAAGQAHRRALTLAERHLGSEHPERGRSLVNLANAEIARGRPELALVMAERGLEVWRAAVGTEHPEFATALLARADALMQRGHVEPAVVELERALKIRETALGPEHAQVAEVRERLERCRGAVVPPAAIGAAVGAKQPASGSSSS